MLALAYTPQIWPHLAAALVAALLTAYTWPRRVVRGGRSFFVCLLVLSRLFFVEILIGTANTVPLRILFYQALAVPAVWGCLLALWVAIDYAGLRQQAVKVVGAASGIESTGREFIRRDYSCEKRKCWSCAGSWR